MWEIGGPSFAPVVVKPPSPALPPAESAENKSADGRPPVIELDVAHHAVLDLRPLETAVFEAFRKQAHARAVPENQLHPVGALGAEHVDRAVERIGADHIANQRGQTFRAFAEVDRSRRNECAHRARRADHFAAFSAPLIAVTIAASAPPRSRLSAAQLSGLVEGLDWRRVGAAKDTPAPRLPG